MPASMRTEQPHPIPTRDPALKWLAAESRSFAEQIADAAPAVRKMREQYRREISSLPEIKTRLDKLKGVKPERLLKCLAAYVQLERDAPRQATTNNANLRDLADRLRSIAGEVEAAYRSDAMRPDLFALSLGFLLPGPPGPPYDYRKAVECMLETVADVETKARTFGRFSKDATPFLRRQPIVNLLQHVCNPKPWRIPECPLELRLLLAELLHAVCKKYGIKHSFTAGSLLKTFNRHVLPRSPEPCRDKTPSQE